MDKTTKIRQVAGSAPDDVIAARFNVTRQRVQQIRKKARIPAYRRSIAGDFAQEHPEVWAKLGTMSDAAIAKEYGVPNWLIGRLRRERQIPLYREDIKARFWRSIEKRTFCDLTTKQEDEHWIWTGSLSNGHPRFVVGENHHVYTRRVSYTMYIGKIPDKWPVYVTCGQQLCVNPHHLSLEKR